MKNSDQDVKRLLQHPGLWRADQLPEAAETLSSGFPELDAHLPGHGWPQSGLSEFMLETAGIGELRLLVPLLQTLSRQERWLAWVNPPFIPYAPALSAAGIDINKILLIHPRSHKDALWALERASKSGSSSVVFAWLDEKQLTVNDTRRLQLAAKQGGTLTCLFRPEQAARMHSMAELRLKMKPVPATGEIAVEICKRRGGWPVAGLQIKVDELRRPAEIREQLCLWRHWHTRAYTRVEPEPAAELALPPIQPAHDGADSRVTH